MCSYAWKTHLNRCILDWLFRIVHILQRNAIELTLIDVGDAIVLTSLRRADRALQVVAKAHVCEATERQREKEERETEIWLILLRYILKFNAIW